MSQEELRRAYDSRRILLETSRVLAPSFNAQGVYLTGAQIEMLRNITAYLNHRSTWVDTYYDTYYMMADDQDFSDILEIVADLEVKIMTSENTIIGFSDGWQESLAVLAGTDGTQIKTTVPVPAGKVLTIEAASWKNNTGARGTMQVWVVGGTETTVIAYSPSPARYSPIIWNGSIKLVEGQYVRVQQGLCLTGDAHDGAVRGWMMDVPE